MLSLLFILSMFVLSVAAILTIDNHFNNCITGVSLLGILAAGLALSWWHGCRKAAMLRKAEMRERLSRLLRCERGEGEPDCLNTLLVIVGLIAIVVFMASGFCKG